MKRLREILAQEGLKAGMPRQEEWLAQPVGDSSEKLALAFRQVSAPFHRAYSSEYGPKAVSNNSVQFYFEGVDGPQIAKILKHPRVNSDSWLIEIGDRKFSLPVRASHYHWGSIDRDDFRRALRPLIGSMKTSSNAKIPASISKHLGKHKKTFENWLASEKTSYDLDAKGSFKEEDGAYIIDLPGGGALDEFGAGFSDEADDIITSVISKMIDVPVKKLKALSFDDYSQTSRGWYVYLPPSKR